MGHGYGKRGGVGPTAGRTAAVYEIVLNSGDVITKKKFVGDKPPQLHAVGYSYPEEDKPRWVYLVEPNEDVEVIAHRYAEQPGTKVYRLIATRVK